MSFPRQLPTPVIPDTTGPLLDYHRELHERLRNWTVQASQAFDRLLLQPIDLNEVPDSVRTVFTCPFAIDTFQDPAGGPAIARAQLVADGVVLPYDPNDPPAAGKWTLRQVDAVTQQIVVGTAPASDIHFGFLVTRPV